MSRPRPGPVLHAYIGRWREMRTNLGQFGGDIGQAVLKSKLSIVPQGPRDDGDEGNEVEGHESHEESNAEGRGGGRGAGRGHVGAS